MRATYPTPWPILRCLTSRFSKEEPGSLFSILILMGIQRGEFASAEQNSELIVQ